MFLNTSQKIGVVAWAAAVLPLIVAVVGIAGIQRITSDESWVRHSLEVRDEVTAVGRYIDAAKGDVRGYLITGDSAYLARHVASVNEAESAFQRALRLVNDNPEQSGRLALVRTLLDERELALQKTIAVGYHADARLGALSDRLTLGERLTMRIDSVLSAIDLREAQLLEQRTRRESTTQRAASLISLLLAAAAVGFAFLFRRSIQHDLSARARAESELRASEAKFAGILDLAGDAIISVDERSRIQHFNRGAEQMFGYLRAEAIGQPLDLLLPARHEHAHAAHLSAFAASPESSRRMGERRQIYGRRRSGDEFPAEASISKLQTERGWLFTAVVRDSTETWRRQLHEHALATAAVDLASAPEYEDALLAVARLPVPAVGAWAMLDLVESDGGETRLRRIAGHHPDPDVSLALAELQELGVDGDSPEPSIDVLRSGEPRLIARLDDDWLEAHLPGARHIALFRDTRARSLLVVPIVGHHGVLGVWTIGSSAEHTFDAYDESLGKALALRAGLAIENSRLLRTAKNATAARDRVLGIVSHDLRNPLGAVSALARRLAEEPVSDDQRRSTGMSILTSASWMDRLIQDLLDIANIEAARLSVDLEPQSVNAILDAAAAMFRDHAAAKRIRLETQISRSSPLVLADGTRIVQVLANLIGNALKFTDANGSIEIGARVLNGEAVVWVRDSGSGIPPAELPHVFDRFWRARRGETERGHGLGLAIAHGIVGAHGGRIWVESVEGEGSTFSFTLPIASRLVPPPSAIASMPLSRRDGPTSGGVGAA